MADNTVKHYCVEIEQIDSCKIFLQIIQKNTIKLVHVFAASLLRTKNYDW